MQPSKRTTIGTTSVAVSPLCLAVAGDPRVVRAAYDAGINFFAITTDMHWPVYEATRRGLAELFRDVPSARDEIAVMGMCYVSEPRFCHAPFAELIAAVPGLVRVDVSCMAAVRNENFLVRWDEHQKHRAAGGPGSRALAASFDDSIAARVAIGAALVDLAILGLRPSNHSLRAEVLRSLPNDSPVAIYTIGGALDVLPERRLKELGVRDGKWRPTLQDYLRYGVFAPGVNGAIVDAHTVSDLELALKSLECGRLTDDECSYLEDLADLHGGFAEIVP